MNRTIDRILAGLMAAVLLSLGAIAAAPVEKTSGNAQESSNLRQVEIVIPLGAPETDAGLSPSALPDLDRATASSWEGETPSALTPGSEIGDESAAISSALYQINWQSINIGGETSTSPGYTALQSLGQEAVGASASASYSVGAGYIYGHTNAGCTCPCKFDPQCDGTVSNVQDVVITINVAFRGAAGTIDPGCARERTDVDANSVTSVTDVVKVINVAFRGQTTAANYVDPCLIP